MVQDWIDGTITAVFYGGSNLLVFSTALGVNVSGVVTAITNLKVTVGSALTGVESWNQFDTWLYGGG